MKRIDERRGHFILGATLILIGGDIRGQMGQYENNLRAKRTKPLLISSLCVGNQKQYKLSDVPYLTNQTSN